MEMEKLKDPAMALSVTNTVALLGSTVYFYRQVEAMKTDMNKVAQTLSGVLRKLAELEKGDQNKGEVLHVLGDQIKKISSDLENKSQSEAIDRLELDLSEIVNTLDDQNIHVDLPSEQPVRSKRYNSRKESKKETKSSRAAVSRDFDSRSRASTKDREPKEREVREARAQVSLLEAESYEDDDTDLIGEVRKQQQTSRI